MVRVVTLLPILCLLVACATEPVEDPQLQLPMPPPAPTRPPALRQAARPAPVAEAEAEAALAGPAVLAEPVAVAPANPAPRLAWRVVRDGVVGCADPATLTVLAQPAERTPRILAEARASGGCRTTFRVNEWVAEAVEADAVRLRLMNGTALTLWFRRGDVIAP